MTKEDNPPKEQCPMCGHKMKYLETKSIGRSYLCNNKTCINDGMQVTMYVKYPDSQE